MVSLKKGIPFIFMTVIEFIEKARRVHGDKYDYSKVDYKDANTKICIICPIHGEFWQTPSKHTNAKQGCPKCSNNIKVTTEEFIKRAINIHGNKYDYSKVDYVNNKTKVCIICPKHEEFWQIPYNHLHGEDCIKCVRERISQQYASTLEEFIEKAKRVHGDRYDYSKVEYKNAQTKVRIICPEHGEFLQTPHKHLQGHGCSQCKYSRLEQQVQILLENNKIEYVSQQTFDWLKNKHNLYLDFYLPKHNVAIECQGEQHFRNVGYFNGEEGFKQRLFRDSLKKQLCEEHGIKMSYFADKEFEEEVIANEEELIKRIIL